MEERLHQRVIGQDDAVARRGQRDSTGPGRTSGSEPAARQLHLPGPDRRRQDRARARPRRVPLRRRARDGAHRHVRVPGEAHRVAADRRAARIRRLRGVRPADRSGPPPAVRGRALRRNREGAPRGPERPVAAARRRPPDGRQGADGGLQERRGHHDVQRRQPLHRRAREPRRIRHRRGNTRGNSPRPCGNISGRSS